MFLEQVKNLRSAVACAAIDTLGDLFLHLQNAMDPEVEGTSQALLFTLAKNKASFSNKHANLALGAMVQNCSYTRTVSALLHKGLR